MTNSPCTPGNPLASASQGLESHDERPQSALHFPGLGIKLVLHGLDKHSALRHTQDLEAQF